MAMITKWRILILSIIIAVVIGFSIPIFFFNIDDEKPKEESYIYKKDNIRYNVNGYCYNPEQSGEEASKDIEEIFLNNITGRDIQAQTYMSWSFFFQDDYCQSISKKDTGDIFHVILYCLNKTSDHMIACFEFDTFPGELDGNRYEGIEYCSADGRSIYYDTKWTLEVEISNCGEYPKYWKLGLISEPDPGNSWEFEMYLEYQYL